MYWESEASVADVAARFDLSRRALYDAIEPYPAGLDCVECGTALVFENRLARSRHTASCPACGSISDIVDEAARDAIDADARVARFPAGVSGATHERADERGELRQRAVLLSGAAIAGIAVGTVATWLARRRD
jgi:hypothetical protein